MLAISKGNVGKIKGDVPIPNIPKFGYKLIELLTHLQVWDSLMLAPIIYPTPDIYTPLQIYIPQLQIYISHSRYIYPTPDIYTPLQIYIPHSRYIYPTPDIYTPLQIYIPQLQIYIPQLPPLTPSITSSQLICAGLGGMG